MEEADGYGFWAESGERDEEAGDLGIGERGEDGAVGGDAFVDREGVVGLNERAWSADLEVIQFGSGLAADEEDVLEACGGEECDSGSLTLQQRIRGNGRPVGDFGGVAGEVGDALEDCAGGIVGCGTELVDAESGGVEEDEVGEGSAGVDTNSRADSGAAAGWMGWRHECG
jgi:hypothetical protein